MKSLNKDISIIIVSWNVKKLLNHCLNSIFKDKNRLHYEVIVVDNNSSDKTVEFIRNDFPQVRLIENKSNIGFAAACNQGLQIATGKFILFLNPDTVLLEEAILKSRLRMERDDKIAVLGPKILNLDLSTQPSCRQFPKLASLILILLKLHHFFPNLASLRNYYMSDFDYDKESEVDQVMGAFLMTRRSIIEDLGPFDEKFKLWFEEVDLCRRVKNAGYQVIYFPGAKIIHHKGTSFRQVAALKLQLAFNRSLLYYFKKHHSSYEYFILCLFFPISLFLAALVQIGRYLKISKSK